SIPRGKPSPLREVPDAVPVVVACIARPRSDALGPRVVAADPTEQAVSLAQPSVEQRAAPGHAGVEALELRVVPHRHGGWRGAELDRRELARLADVDVGPQWVE